MLTSNIDELLLKSQVNTKIKEKFDDDPFINSLIDTKIDGSKSRTASFTYENIKGISFEEIETLFLTIEDKEKAKNLRLATMFTEDDHLGQALFNTVLGLNFSMQNSYLYETYEDKHNFLNSISNKNRSLSELLHSSVSKRYELSKIGKVTDVIPQEYLNEILLEVNSFNFLSAISNSSRDLYGRYKNKDDDYSFLYNDYSLKYQELIYKYEDSKSFERGLLNQYR